jgi:hypothetical protein
MRITDDKLTFFKNLYEDAKLKTTAQRNILERHLKQYKGDKEIDGSTEAATAIRNITYELIESQVSTEIPMPKCTAARYNERHNRNAISAERLLRQVRDQIAFEEKNDLDERYTYVFGSSVWLVEWDDTIGDENQKGGVKITTISPQDFFPQPNVWEVEDLEYAFFRYNSTVDDVESRYGVSVAIEDLDSDDEITPKTDGDTITVVVCYYKVDGIVCKYVFSGDTELEDVDEYYARRVKVCKVCGKDEGDCTCEKPKWKVELRDFEELTEDIYLADGTKIPAMSPALNEDGTIRTRNEKVIVKDANNQPIVEVINGAVVPKVETVPVKVMEPTKIPYFAPTVYPFVIRKNISEYRSLFGQSDCEALRPYQQAINKVESRIMQKLMWSSVSPVLPEDADVVAKNTIFGQVIKLRPGENKGQYGVLDTTPNIQMDIMEADRIYEYAKSAVGITNAFRGEADYAGQSGKAVQALMQQSAGRLESKRVMKRAAYAALDKIIWQFYLAYADEPRKMQYVDSFGMSQEATFNRYDFLDMDEFGRWEYNADYNFSTDASGGMEQQREAIWEMNLKNLQQGTYGNPADPQTLLRYWMMQERAHYPNASENVEYFKQIVRTMLREPVPQMIGGQENGIG